MKVSFSATSYLRPIRQYAQSQGMPFFKWSDIKKAIARYEIFQAIKN